MCGNLHKHKYTDTVVGNLWVVKIELLWSDSVNAECCLKWNDNLETTSFGVFLLLLEYSDSQMRVQTRPRLLDTEIVS